MKKLLIALSALILCQPVFADRYPGDAAFEAIRYEVYGGIVKDDIEMTFNENITTRNQLCNILVNRHNNNRVTYREGDRSNGRILTTETNAKFIGVRLTELDCLNALWYSDGYDSSAGWRAWAGKLDGTWFNDERFFDEETNQFKQQTFTDPATWLSPEAERGERTYYLQSVIFSGRSATARYGWNKSSRDVAYVWGWDGKDNTDNGGKTGMHVGFTFEKSGAHCIIWATTEEAFLECVKPSYGGLKKRTSTGFFGIGQWIIH